MKYTQSNFIVINADRDMLYPIICNSRKWPTYFEPCLDVKVLDEGSDWEHIQITANIHEKTAVWESHRTFLRDMYGINSKILKPMPLVKEMSTCWRVLKIAHDQCIITLEHLFDICDDIKNVIDGIYTHSEALSYIQRAIHGNSTKELLNIKNLAESQKKGQMNVKWTTCHSINCDTNAQHVYDIIRDMSSWPNWLEACQSVHILEKHANRELLKIQAYQNNKIVSWNTQREYYDKIFRIDFTLPVPMPLLKSMNGEWRVIPLSENKCQVFVIRNFELLDNVQGIQENISNHLEAYNFINRFIENNAQNEMAALKFYAENPSPDILKFRSHYIVPGKIQSVYQFFSDFEQWSVRLPHCINIEVIYNDQENQEFIMDIQTIHGIEKFRSIRRCDSQNYHISYFQPKPPIVLKKHMGSWTFKEVLDGTEVISEHTIQINAAECAKLFNKAYIFENKRIVKDLIQKNSRATVEACIQSILKSKEKEVCL